MRRSVLFVTILTALCLAACSGRNKPAPVTAAAQQTQDRPGQPAAFEAPSGQEQTAAGAPETPAPVTKAPETVPQAPAGTQAQETAAQETEPAGRTSLTSRKTEVGTVTRRLIVK